MNTTSARIDREVEARAMLKHPFYRAWTEGRLSLDVLRAYARQYFHLVEAFPRAVSAVHSFCPDREDRPRGRPLMTKTRKCHEWRRRV